jgi:hypothetical protein
MTIAVSNGIRIGQFTNTSVIWDISTGEANENSPEFGTFIMEKWERILYLVR